MHILFKFFPPQRVTISADDREVVVFEHLFQVAISEPSEAMRSDLEVCPSMVVYEPESIPYKNVRVTVISVVVAQKSKLKARLIYERVHSELSHKVVSKMLRVSR